MVKALEEDRLDETETILALRTLAKFGKQAAPALPVAEKLLWQYRGVWSRNDFSAWADAAADVLVAAGDPDKVGPLFAAELDAFVSRGQSAEHVATYLACLRGLAKGNYASSELLIPLKVRAGQPLTSKGWGEPRRALAALAKIELLLKQQAAAKKNPEPVTLPSAQEESPIVAVFDVEDASDLLKEMEREQLQDFLAARLTELARFKVVPREQLKARLLDQKTSSYKECYDTSCQIELGREVAAQKTVATRIIKMGESCVVTSQLYDLKTATTERAATAKVECNAEKLLEGIDLLARQLATP